MTIALCIWQLDTYGGSIRQILELARYLQKQGHTVDVFAYSVDRQRCFPEFIDEVNVIVPKPLPQKQILYAQSDPISKRIWAFLYNEYLQLLQVNAIGTLILREHEKKHYDVINFHDHGVYRLASRFDDLKKIWMMNDPPSFIDAKEKDASAYSQTTLMKILAWIETWRTRRAVSHLDSIVVLDNRNKDIIRRYFARDAIVVKSGLSIDSSYLSYKEVQERKNKAHAKEKRRLVYLLTTNIFFRHRRYEDLIEAANLIVHSRKIQNVQFRIVGDPSPDMGYFNTIQKLVKKYKLERHVHFLGKVTEKELGAEYRRADVFVFPNHNQTWGLSVFEASLRGAAIIVSKTAGAHDVLTDGKNALFIEPKSPQDLADKIEQVVCSEKVRSRIAKAAHDFVIKNISWEKYAKDMTAVFV